ncbi:hypothetical protein [Mycobacterium avium]|uniref:hypothetical protein n=3 Tax=Mycobacterium avium TaxID=1764 RepID=UPI001CD91E71|nr:hypothetical protein [Mycobacterium avium]MCA2281834.1 hypothetical protein [Mycobacterium avium]MCA2286665.1 hypothetical protein [Mycobacterium avium]
MGTATFDRAAARATLVERGLTPLAADEFLMRSLLTATEVATVLGVKDSRAARDTLRRWAVKPISRGPGRSGQNTYPAELVWHHQQNRPGRGWRKGRSTPENDEKETTTMSSTSPTTALSDVDPWYSHHDDVVALASVLVEADWLDTPHDVVDFFAKPWKWGAQWMIWAHAGRPFPPSSDDLAQAHLLGRGTLRRELERRYQDDTAQWEALTKAFDEFEAGDALAPDQPDDDRATSNVRPLKRPMSSIPEK